MSRYDTSLTRSNYFSPNPTPILILSFRYKCPQIRTTLVCPGHVLTPMFRTVKFSSSALFRFFCPSIQPVAVVKRIIAALDDQYSEDIFLPFYTNFIPYVGHLPSFLRDFVQWVGLSLISG